MEKRFISIQEAIQLTSLSRASINRLILSGEIPSYKINGRRVFEKGELIEWIQKHKSFEMKTLGKNISALEEAFNDEKALQDMPYEQKMRLYALLMRSMNRRLRNIQSSIPKLFEGAGLSDSQK